MSLSFDTLREANVERLGSYKVCDDWTPSQWLQALVGEVGEYANYRKKFERGDTTEEEFLKEAGKELADIQIYLDILAHKIGVDLGEATRDKFNEVSHRIGSDVFIAKQLDFSYLVMKGKGMEEKKKILEEFAKKEE